ncbi:MAG: type II secretion system F family protein [bacterium]|nr:type II secretion system F family protein [bacterium]
MPVFQYKAKRFDGKTIAGVIELDSEMTLIDRLHRKNAVLLSASQIEDGRQAKITKAGFGEKLRTRFNKIFNSISSNEILLFTHQMAAMFGAGVPLSRCLESLGKDLKNKKFRDIVSEIHRDIESGDDLSEAMAKHPHVFSKLYINMIHAGESSGTLATILSQLSFYQETATEVRGKLKAALAYPIALISFTLVVMLILLLVIIPQFNQIYSRLNTPLPLPTKILMKISTTIRYGYYWYLIGFFSLWVLWGLILQTSWGRYTWDRLKLRIPIIGPIILKGIFTQFSRTLSILLKSGLPVIQSLRIISESTPNAYIKKKVEECAIKIQKGATISEAFAEGEVFPELMLQMISSGEESGTLFAMLAKVADFYQQQVSTTVATLTSIIEPVLIVIMGLIIGSIAISVFLPIFKMGGAFH